jgi:hypothetical protein
MTTSILQVAINLVADGLVDQILHVRDQINREGIKTADVHFGHSDFVLTIDDPTKPTELSSYKYTLESIKEAFAFIQTHATVSPAELNPVVVANQIAKTFETSTYQSA